MQKDAALPRWFDRLEGRWQGVCFGLLLGVIAVMGVGPERYTSAAVVVSLLVLATVPTIPRRVLEYRARVRSMRERTTL